MLLDPPLPVAAFYLAAADVLRVVFDQPLQPGATAAANWGGCIAFPPLLTVTGAAPGVIAGSQVDVPCVRGGICLGADECGYNAAPPDVFNLDGVPAVTFSNFPVTLLP